LPEDADYKRSTQNIHCYEDNNVQELNWDGKNPCLKVSAAIHKGHMVASNFGRGGAAIPTASSAATFTYTNAVPQMGVFNSCPWKTAEGTLVKWAAECQQNAKAGLEARIYIVIGVVPTSFSRQAGAIYFGSAGFGSFQGPSKFTTGTRKGKSYRILVPEIMWTAACCMFTDGSVHDTFGYWRENEPSKDVVYYYYNKSLFLRGNLSTPGKYAHRSLMSNTPIQSMFKDINAALPRNISPLFNAFPAVSGCA
jgi:hypothetical protein